MSEAHRLRPKENFPTEGSIWNRCVRSLDTFGILSSKYLYFIFFLLISLFLWLPWMQKKYSTPTTRHAARNRKIKPRLTPPPRPPPRLSTNALHLNAGVSPSLLPSHARRFPDRGRGWKRGLLWSLLTAHAAIFYYSCYGNRALPCHTFHIPTTANGSSRLARPSLGDSLVTLV